MTSHEADKPGPGDEFTLFHRHDLNNRDIIRDNQAVVLRTQKLQTVTIEKPIAGTYYFLISKVG
jgi:hypothetical protein